jgi:hypothetical protein
MTEKATTSGERRHLSTKDLNPERDSFLDGRRTSIDTLQELKPVTDTSVKDDRPTG